MDIDPCDEQFPFKEERIKEYDDVIFFFHQSLVLGEHL